MICYNFRCVELNEDIEAWSFGDQTWSFTSSQNFSYFDEPEVDHNGCVESEKFARMMDDITLQIFPARGHAWPGSLLHWMNIYCFMKPLKSCIQLSRPSD